MMFIFEDLNIIELSKIILSLVYLIEMLRKEKIDEEIEKEKCFKTSIRAKICGMLVSDIYM